MISPRTNYEGFKRRTIAQRLVDPEVLLQDCIRKLEPYRDDRYVMIVHMSRLQPSNRRDHHLRIAISTFDVMVKMMKGELFELGNCDLVFIYKSSASEEAETQGVKLKFMFADDPLLAKEGGEGEENFIDWHYMGTDFEDVSLFAQNAAQEAKNRHQEGQESKIKKSRPPLSVREDPLTAELLARVEEHLAGAGLFNLLRRQTVCAIVGKSVPQPIFRELFISIADLRQTLIPNVNLASSPWLFQQLTETLDRRVLALLNKHDDSTIAGDVSINLNVQTLITQDFFNFDDSLKANTRGTIVLELQKVDIFADLGAYLFARDFAHGRGYRICIDGADIESLPFIDRERLGLDLVKIIWSDEMALGQMPNGERVADYVRKTGPTRVILCRCDSQDSIDCGQEMGITLFQGRHVETLLAQGNRK